MLKRSVGKFFILKIDLVYFDLGALFQIPRLSLNRLTGPDNANKSMTLSAFESQPLVTLAFSFCSFGLYNARSLPWPISFENTIFL